MERVGGRHELIFCEEGPAVGGPQLGDVVVKTGRGACFRGHGSGWSGPRGGRLCERIEEPGKKRS